MSLKQLIIQQKPRETSGSRSSNRFDFQKTWALCHLLELHRTDQEYLMVFDYHDDILVLDSSSEPSRIDFYQIKTRTSGHWTRTALLAREKGDSGPLPSILGKLVGNKLTFPEHAGKLTLVSNQCYKLKVDGQPDSTVQHVCLRQLVPGELAVILKAIREEHNLATDLDCADRTYLTVTSLSLLDHDKHAMGVLADFLDKLYPNEKVPLTAIYRTLYDEIKRKTNSENLPSDFDDLCRTRAISRETFAHILQDIRPSGQYDTSIAEAMSALQHEGMGFDDIQNIRRACMAYEVARMDNTNLVLAKARKAIEVAVTSLRKTGKLPLKLTEAIAAVREMVHRSTRVVVSTSSEHYRTAMIVVALYGI